MGKALTMYFFNLSDHIKRIGDIGKSLLIGLVAKGFIYCVMFRSFTLGGKLQKLQNVIGIIDGVVGAQRDFLPVELF